MSERVWDGRGDALEDARLTTVDGRMADDLRLKLPHFRVMAHVGRQNGRRGWLRISQTELAKRWGLHRNSVNRAFIDLVAWGYLLQRTQEETAGESFCQYKVILDGDDSTPSEVKARAGRAPPQPVSDIAGGCTVECAGSDGGGAQQNVQACTVAEYRPAQPTSTPPVYRGRAHRLSPTDADTPHSQTALTLRATGEGERGRSGLNTRGWKADWDQAARNAVQDLLATELAHVATHLLIPVVGTLGPPRGVHGASYVRDLAEMVGRYPPEVLAAVARALKLHRETDLPAARSVHALARAAAPMAGADASTQGAAARAGQNSGQNSGRPAPDVDGWLAALASGDGADPTVALCRQLVQRLGAEVAVAWFAGVVVERAIDPGGSARLRLTLPSPFLARYVAGRFSADILLAARACWPDDAAPSLTITERSQTHAA